MIAVLTLMIWLQQSGGTGYIEGKIIYKSYNNKDDNYIYRIDATNSKPPYPNNTATIYVGPNTVIGLYPKNQGYNIKDLYIGMTVRLHIKSYSPSYIEIINSPRHKYDWIIMEEQFVAKATRQVDDLTVRLGSKRYQDRALARWEIEHSGNELKLRVYAQAMIYPDKEIVRQGKEGYEKYLKETLK
jgi:hypothetical protein